MADQKVKQRAKAMQEYDHEHPGDFFAVGQTFVLNGVNNHPNPEHKRQQTDDGQKQQHEYSDDSSNHIFPFRLSVLSMVGTPSCGVRTAPRAVPRSEDNKSGL